MRKRNVHWSSGEQPVSAISQKSRSHAAGVIRGIGGERVPVARCRELTEPVGETPPTSKKPSDSARAEIGRFFASVMTLALLAGYSRPP